MTRRLRPVEQTPRRLIAYVRQSVEREESISPAVQEQSCRDYADRLGDRVVQVISDVGVSGLKWDRRPGIQRAMAAIADGHADGIVVWRWSRLSRNRLHQALALDAVERAGGVVESATEPFDTTTAGGRFGREVMLAAAAFESQQKAEQWADAHRRRLDRGLPASGGQRLGYRIVGDRYEPDPETAPIVAELFSRYLVGAGLEQLSGWLAAAGVVSPKTGQRWTKRGVGYYLGAGFPAGLLLVGGEYLPGDHEAIIDSETWRRYLVERERRTTVAPRLLHPTTRLAGLVRCAGCGRSMSVRYGPYPRYRCSTRDCTERAAARLTHVESKVRDWLPTVAALVDSMVKRSRPATGKAMAARLARQVVAADTALAKLTADLARGLVPEMAYRAARAELERERNVAQSELNALTPPVPMSGITDAAAGLLVVWDEADPADVNAVARELLTVRVSRGAMITVVPTFRT